MSSNSVSTNKSSNSDFLSGFVEGSVELPDGLNGDCVVHYEGEHSNCELNVRLVNGMREGMGTVMKEGTPFIQIEYHHGVPNGSVCRMNDCGVVVLRGQVRNGVEDGLFEEYDDDGKKRYIGRFTGDVWSGFKRDGRGYSIDKNGTVKQYCMYSEGVIKGVIQAFNGSTMTEYYENGRIKYEGEYTGTIENGFVWEGEGKEYDENGKTMVYSGGWRGGKRNGEGREWNENGIRSNGTWNDGKMEYGFVYEWDENGVIKRGLLYEDGEMKRVVEEFNGSTTTAYYPDGKLFYEGEFKFNEEYGLFLAEGKGKAYEWDGKTLVYSGEWKNDRPNGFGTMYKNGHAIYTGELKNGIAEGSGTEYENGHVVYTGEWKYNMRNGKGTEYRDDHAIYTGEWKYSMRNGNGKEMDENGRVVFEGEWKDGIGKGKEMDANGNVVYEGEWSDGKRNGIGREVNGNETGPIGNWKDGRIDGIVLERDENGVIKLGYLYENGEMKRVIQEWELCHMILSRRIDYVIPHILDDSSFFVSDLFTGHTNGVFQLNGKHFSFNLFKNTAQVVMVDVNRKNMIVNNNGDWVVARYAAEAIRLDTNGRRWEGGVRDGKPYGYGVIYVGEGRKEYEGFMMDGMRVCYGIEYYSDVGKVEYEGGYYDDKRFGKGVLYDRNGAIDYQGLWNNNEPYSPHFDGKMMDSHTECIDVPNDSFNDSTSFILNSFIHSLRRIVIGDDCFGSVRFFELDGLDELRSIMIGKRSFTIGKDLDTIKTSERTDGTCRIVNCPKLYWILIRDFSFGNYRSFELTNLPSLETIEIGDGCFYFASFILTDLPDLLSVNLGEYAFHDCHSVVFENLPKLQSIQLESDALRGDWGEDRKAKSGYPFNYKNTLTMRNLPSLTYFKGDEHHFNGIGSVILESIPQLEPSGIHFSRDACGYIYSFQSSKKTPLPTSHVVRESNELDSIPLDAEDLWIERFDDTGVTDFSFGSFQLLRSLVIGKGVFWGLTHFELGHLPSLQSIFIDDISIYWCPSFSLTDLPQLQSVNLGWNAFNRVHSVVFENLPKLQSIQLGDGALQGDGRDHRKTIEEVPYKYKNTLTMRNLPSLTEFKGNEENFQFIGSVILENIPQLETSGIQFGICCFKHTYSLQSSSTFTPLSSSFDATALASTVTRKHRSIT